MPRQLATLEGHGLRKASPFLVLVSTGLVLLVAGCTSDPPNTVGVGLVDTQIEVELEPVVSTQIPRYTARPVKNVEVPVHNQYALYMGDQEGNASAIVVNYDFAEAFDDSVTIDMIRQDNIQSPRLRLMILHFYQNLPRPSDPDVSGLQKVYEVYQLEAPFDSTAFPGPIPAYDPQPLNVNFDPDEAEDYLVEIDLYNQDFVEWVLSGAKVGFLIMEGESPDPGLIGMSARDNKLPSSILGGEPITERVLGPALLARVIDIDYEWSIAPYADASTFNEISTIPAAADDGFMVRTCLRAYPGLLFDYSELPPDVFINRAVLSVTNDTTTAFGNLESLVVSEMDTIYFAAPGDTLLLTDLNRYTYNITGWNSLDPTRLRTVEFDVTTAVQRIINNVYEGTRGFMITAGEDFYPTYDISGTDPDFYFIQFNFFGTSAPDSLRPKLKITYSGLGDLGGGGR